MDRVPFLASAGAEEPRGCKATQCLGDGSGKTTLLRHMLDNAQGRRIAVIVNEFGELGIDGEILKQCSIGCTEEEANGRVYELANGCLCCTVQEEFFPVMRELVARRGDLDHILIETSGLALRSSSPS